MDELSKKKYLKYKQKYLQLKNQLGGYVATLRKHSSSVRCVAFHPTTPLLATGSEDKTVILWCLKPDYSSTTCDVILKGHSGSVTSVAFHPTAPLMATSSTDKTVKFIF